MPSAAQSDDTSAAPACATTPSSRPITPIWRNLTPEPSGRSHNSIEPWQPTPDLGSDPLEKRRSQKPGPARHRSRPSGRCRAPGGLSAQSEAPRGQRACGWLFSGIQVMKPGERAGAHKHAASAFGSSWKAREPTPLSTATGWKLEGRDFVITPNGTWHEHGIAEDGEVSMWQDGLDIRSPTRWRRISTPFTRTTTRR